MSSPAVTDEGGRVSSEEWTGARLGEEGVSRWSRGVWRTIGVGEGGIGRAAELARDRAVVAGRWRVEGLLAGA